MKITITLNKTTTSTMINDIKDMTAVIGEPCGASAQDIETAKNWCEGAAAKVNANKIDFKVANPASSLALNSKGNDVVVDFEVSDKIILSSMKIFGKIARRIAPMITMAKGAYGIIQSLIGDVKADLEELYKDYVVPADQCRYGYLHKDITVMESKYDVDIIVKNDGYNDPMISNMAINTGDQKISKFVFDNIKSNADSVIAAAPQVFSLDAVTLLKQMMNAVNSEENLTIDFHSVEGHDRIYYITGDIGGVYGAFRRTSDSTIVVENVDDINDYTHKTTHWASIEPNINEVASTLAEQARGVPFYGNGVIETYTADEYNKVFHGIADDDDDVEEEALEVIGNHDAGNTDE